MKFFSKKLKPMSDQEIEERVDNILSGKDKSINANIVRKLLLPHRKMGESEEMIRQEMIKQFKIKYNGLQTKEKSAEELLKESEAEIKESNTGMEV